MVARLRLRHSLGNLVIRDACHDTPHLLEFLAFAVETPSLFMLAGRFRPHRPHLAGRIDLPEEQVTDAMNLALTKLNAATQSARI